MIPNTQEAHEHRLAMLVFAQSDIRHEHQIDELFERAEKIC